MKKGKYASTEEMIRDLSSTKAVADQTVHEIDGRRILDTLMAQRALLDMSQKDVADKMNCTQSRVSKLENGKDDDLPIGAFRDYAAALGLEMSIVLSRSDKPTTIVDRVKQHTFAIRRLLTRLTKLAGDDGAMVDGTKQFLCEVILNAAKSVVDANKNLQAATSRKLLQNLPVETRPVISIEEIEPEEDERNELSKSDERVAA